MGGEIPPADLPAEVASFAEVATEAESTQAGASQFGSPRTNLLRKFNGVKIFSNRHRQLGNEAFIEIDMNIAKTKIPSTKGNLAATINYPKKETDRLAILCPGYLDSKDYKHLVGLAGVLSKQGYTVVRFDPTGTWESEGGISDYTTTQYIDDIKNVLEYMLKQADYKQILLGGHSRGGMVSILYAARDPRISLVLGIMPSSGPMQGQRREKWKKAGISISSRDLPDNKNEKREFRVPFDHVLDRDQYDAIGDVREVEAPIVLVAGELDDLVLPGDVREIFNSANEPKRFLVIPGIGHDYRHNESEVAMVNEKILEQLNSMQV